MIQAEESVKENILARLKRETAPDHERTEKLMNLMEPGFSLADYKALLQKFYAFYSVFEDRLLNALKENRVTFDYQARLKTPQLIIDLQALKADFESISPIDRSSDLPALESAEKIFGTLYVIEGSTLGGQLISRHLKTTFDLDETNGAAFFSGYNSQTGAMWNAFRIEITEFAESSSDHDAIIGAAAETFQKIYQVLNIR